MSASDGSEKKDSSASETGKPLRMNAYYYSFNETGSLEIDGILSAVAVAGKAFHHTQNWSDEDSNYGDGSLIDLIQNKAIAAANQIASLTERVKELEDEIKLRQDYLKLGDNQKASLQAQLDAANKRNDELQEIHKQDLIKHERLERQLEKQGKALKSIADGDYHTCSEGYDWCTCADRFAEQAIQSAAEIRDGM